MARTRFEVRFAECADCRPTAGRRAASTKPSSSCLPNPGEDLRPLARIVSGGELSRIMLALKSLASIDATRRRR